MHPEVLSVQSTTIAEEGMLPTRPAKDWPGRFERPKDNWGKGSERRPVAVTGDNQQFPERHLAAKRAVNPLPCESLARSQPRPQPVPKGRRCSTLVNPWITPYGRLGTGTKYLRALDSPE